MLAGMSVQNSFALCVSFTTSCKRITVPALLEQQQTKCESFSCLESSSVSEASVVCRNGSRGAEGVCFSVCWRVYRLLPSLRFEPLPCFLISTSSCIQWQQQGNQNELLLNSRSMSRSDQQLSARSIKSTLNRSSSHTSGAPRGKNTTGRCKTATSSVKKERS